MKSQSTTLSKWIVRHTAQLEPAYKGVKRFFLRHTATDVQWVIILLILASLLRLPFLNHPNDTVFDEVVYANYVTFQLEGHPYFDIHPPSPG